MNFQQQLKENPRWSSFILHLCLFSIIFIFFEPYFQTNDDVGMMLLVSGKGITDQPSNYVLFMNVVMGDILKWLYIQLPQVPWYAYFWIVCLFFSYCQIGFLIFKYTSATSYLPSFCYILFFAVCGIDTIISLQFTIVASLLTITGICTFLFDTRINFVWYFKMLVLLLLASTIRFDAMLMIQFLSIPIYIFVLVSESNRKLLIIRYINLVTIIVFCISIHQYSNYKYNKIDRDAVLFNSYRAVIVDNKQIYFASKEQKSNALKAAQWSENDYDMLMSWFFINEDIYNIDSFQSALNQVPTKLSKFNPINIRSYFFLYDIYTSLSGIKAFAISFFMFLLLKKRILKLFSFFTWGWSIVCITIINYLFKFPPERVFIPIFLFLALVSLLLAINEKQKLHFQHFMYLILLLIMLLVSKNLITIKENMDMAKHNNTILKESIAQMNPKPSDLYIVWGAGFPFEAILPFGSLDYLKSLQLCSLGTHQLFIDNKKLLHKYGITDLYLDLATKPNIYLCIYPSITSMSLYSKYMQEHYQQDVIFEKIAQIGNREVLRIRLKKEK